MRNSDPHTDWANPSPGQEVREKFSEVAVMTQERDTGVTVDSSLKTAHCIVAFKKVNRMWGGIKERTESKMEKMPSQGTMIENHCSRHTVHILYRYSKGWQLFTSMGNSSWATASLYHSRDSEQRLVRESSPLGSLEQLAKTDKGDGHAISKTQNRLNSLGSMHP